MNFSDPFGLCPIEKDGVPCKLYVTAYGAAHGASLSALQVSARHGLYDLAQRSGHDLGVNATTNGTHDDPRHNGVSNCCPERDDPNKAGLAVDIGEVDHHVVGTAEASSGVADVQQTGLDTPGVMAVIDPNGYWLAPSQGKPKQVQNDPATVRQHGTHMHVDFW